ncbi:hypothetical protein, partial [Marinobacter lutaoensis]|uniref:hypothetical protein n=1 Tax=Marinobacter lutaoensis TaxID=135739 RepID=UPI001C3E416F
SVAAFAWNGWQASSGISGNLGLEYAQNIRIALFLQHLQCNCLQQPGGLSLALSQLLHLCRLGIKHHAFGIGLPEQTFPARRPVPVTEKQ